MEELLTRKHTNLILAKLNESGMMGLPMRRINGVMVDAWMSIRSSIHGAFESNVVRIIVKADYQEKLLWKFERGYGTNAEAFDMMGDDFHKEMNKMGNLEFSKLSGKLCEKRGNVKKVTDNLLLELLDKLFVGEQFTLTRQDCCVCYDKTIDTLRCGHHLCLVCESSMKELKCPLCRQDYHRCGACKNDAECDCYDDDEDDD